MPTSYDRRFTQGIFDYVDGVRRLSKAQPLKLNSPSGYIGNLPQTQVSYDAAEVSSSAGSSTLLDNMNHIRQSISVLSGASFGDPLDVGSANVLGSGGSVPHSNHVHRGVHSFAKSGSAALYGDATISAGANVTLTQAGQDVQIAAASERPAASTAALDVSSAGATGSSGSDAHADHVHKGVYSLAVSGQSQIFGDVILAQGTNVTLTESGGSVTIAATATSGGSNPGGGNMQVQFNDVGLFGGDSGLTYNKTTKVLTLSGTAPMFVMTDTTASAKSLTVAVDANIVDLRESAGASGSLIVLDLANNRVGVGLAAPLVAFHAATPTNNSVAFFDEYSGAAETAIQYSPFVSRTARGTPASPVALATDDFVLGIAGRGYGTSFPLAQVAIFGKAAENFTATQQGTYLTLETTLIGSVTRAERVRITDAGNVVIGATVAGATAAKTLAFTNAATAPTNSVDLAHLYANDFAVGDARLYIYTEQGTAISIGNDAIVGGRTFNLFNTVTTTLNIGGAATTIAIGAATGTTTINNAVVTPLTVTAKPTSTAGIALNPNAATGNYTLSLSPANLTAARRVTFPNADLDMSGSGSMIAGQVLRATAATTAVFASLIAADIPSLAASIITSGALALARGGTNADLSASGSATAFLAQAADHSILARSLVVADLPALPKTRVFNSANQSIPDTTYTAITFDSESVDTDTMHSIVTNTNRITITTAGTYLVGALVMMAANATGVRGIVLLVNNTTYIYYLQNPTPSATQNTTLLAISLYVFAANDYVEVKVNQTSGGALNSVYGAGYAPVFWATKVG